MMHKLQLSVLILILIVFISCNDGTDATTDKIRDFDTTHIPTSAGSIEDIPINTNGPTESANIQDNAGDKIEPIPIYRDIDSDGFGDPNFSTYSNLPVEGWSEYDTDCDDSNAFISPSMDEICNDIDDNCNGEIDEGVTSNYYRDSDGDGFGDPNDPILDCSIPEGYVENGSDPNDSSSCLPHNCNAIFDSNGDLAIELFEWKYSHSSCEHNRLKIEVSDGISLGYPGCFELSVRMNYSQNNLNGQSFAWEELQSQDVYIMLREISRDFDESFQDYSSRLFVLQSGTIKFFKLNCDLGEEIVVDLEDLVFKQFDGDTYARIAKAHIVSIVEHPFYII